ncbi:hypothetical protein D3C76_1832980 [compost metagenome]
MRPVGRIAVGRMYLQTAEQWESPQEQCAEHYAHAHQHCPLEREALMITELDPGQCDQQVG